MLVLIKKQTALQKTEIDLYTEFIDEFLKFAMTLGTMLGFAFGEIREKRDAIIANRQTLIKIGFVKTGTDEAIYIEDFCKVEMKHKLTHLNASNGEKYFDSKKAPKWIFDYMATSYVWVRQQWLFEYMGDNFH